MQSVTTSDLLRAPLNLSPDWRYLFEAIIAPIEVIIRLRHDNELPTMSEGQIRPIIQEGFRAHARLREATRILDGLALKSWEVCLAVNRNTGPAFGLLTGMEHIFLTLNEPKRTAEFEWNRGHLVKAVKAFDEQPLLRALREAVTAERAIEFSPQGDDGAFGEQSPESFDASTGAAKPPKEPSDIATKAYRLYILRGMKQSEIAKELSKELGRSITQGQVSRFVSDATDWIKAGNVLPELPSLDTKPSAVDPDLIDLGQQGEHRVKRQRPRRSDED